MENLLFLNKLTSKNILFLFVEKSLHDNFQWAIDFRVFEIFEQTLDLTHLFSQHPEKKIADFKTVTNVLISYEIIFLHFRIFQNTK